MAFESSFITTVATFWILGIWTFSRVESICPHHCLRNLPSTDTCQRRMGTSLMKDGVGVGGSPPATITTTTADKGKQKRTGGLDNHGNCRVVDQGSLTYQFRLTDTGEHCTKCSCELGQPAGSDPTCSNAPHEECTKLGLTPVLRGPPTNNRPPPPPAQPDYQRPPPPAAQPDYQRPPPPRPPPPSQQGQGQGQDPDFDDDFEFENGHQPSNINSHPGYQKPNDQYLPPEDLDGDYQFQRPPTDPNSNLQTNPDEFDDRLPPQNIPPGSLYPNNPNLAQRPYNPNWATGQGQGQEFEYNIRPQPPPRRRPPHFSQGQQFQGRPSLSNWATGQGQGQEYEYNNRPPQRRRPAYSGSGHDFGDQRPVSSNWATGQGQDQGQEYDYNSRPPQRRRPAYSGTGHDYFDQRPVSSNWATGQSQGQDFDYNSQPPQRRRPSYSTGQEYNQRPAPSNYVTDPDFDPDLDLPPPRRPSKDNKFTDQQAPQPPPLSNLAIGDDFDFVDPLPPPPPLATDFFQNNSKEQETDPNLGPEYDFHVPPPSSNLPVEEEFPPDSNVEMEHGVLKPIDSLESEQDFEFQLKPSSNYLKGRPPSIQDFEPFT